MKKSIIVASLLFSVSGLVSIITVISGWSSPCYAEAGRPFKIATVSISQVINGLKESKKKKEELKKMQEQAKKKISAKRDNLKNMEERIKKIKPLEDSDEVVKLRKEVREFERLMKDEEEELKRKYIEVNRELTSKAIRAVRNYAAKNKLDLVLEKSAGVRSPIIYGESNIDITAKIIAILN